MDRNFRLSYFGNSARRCLVVITGDSLYANTVNALVDSIAVSEEFLHDHRLLASNAAESTGPALVNEKSEVYAPTVRFLLQILAIFQGLGLPVGDVLGSGFVFEAPSYNHWGLVSISYEDRVFRVGNLDLRWSSNVLLMTRRLRALGHPRSLGIESGGLVHLHLGTRHLNL